MDDLLEHFIVEARELVQQATDDLLALERNPADALRLDSVFRAVHTLKGSVGLFDFAPMGLILHAGEDLLSALREGQAVVDASIVDALLECIAQMERWVGVIETTAHLPVDAMEEGRRLAQELRSRLGRIAPAGSPAQPAADPGWVDALLAGEAGLAARAATREGPLVAIRYTPRSDCFFTGDDPVALLRSVPDQVAVRISNRDPWPPLNDFDPFSCNLRIEALSAASLDEVKAVFRFVPDQVLFHEIAPRGLAASEKPPEEAAEPAAASMGAAGARTLRVDAQRIDRLADLVAELIIAKNALAHLAARAGDGMDLAQLTQGIASSQVSIDRLAGEMHRAVMDVRMLPLREVFRRFPRVVRDISNRLGKLIDFSMEGEGVEVDKSTVEGLFEPLLHVIRNAIDHGAEPEEARLSAGKGARAKVALRARREGDRAVIEVADDGRGIDPAKIRRVAHDRNLLPGAAIDSMSDADVLNLIFAPGFSTASEVTDLSGRGVGMDVVQATISRMGGRIAVDSAPGRGTTVRLSLPLTVVMTKVMTVHVGEERYGIPIDGIIETAFVPSDRIVPVRDARAFVLRDRTLPLVSLADLLGVAGARDTGRGAKVLVMPVANDLVGLAVDGFAERMDVLMRPMTGLLAGMPGITGTTLLGDGSVLMILDVLELIG